jgi:hypothetical protein
LRKKLFSALVAVIFLVSICSFVPLVRANVSRVPGVKAGDWAKYTVLYNYTTNDTNPIYFNPSFEDLEYCKMEIPSVVGTNVTYRIVYHYFNGTEMAWSSWVDVSTGATYYGSSGTGPVIAANLTAGDQVYLNSYSPMLNKTETGTYVGSQREVNCLCMVQNYSSSYQREYMNVSYCWDRSSGIFAEIYENVTMVNISEGYFTHLEISLVISETNIWQPTPTIAAHVFITPRMINLRSGGRWIQAIIQLPAHVNARNVDPSTIRMNGTVPIAGKPIVIGRWLIVKFDRSKVASLIQESIRLGGFRTVTLTITGSLRNGSIFRGSDRIVVMSIPPLFRAFNAT